MSWKKLEKRIAYTARRNILVGCGSNGGAGRFKQWFNLIFRADPLQAPWLAVGKTVTVELGEGLDREYLRVSPGGSFLLTRSGIKTNIDPATSLKIPALPFQHIAKRQMQPCDYQIDGNSLIITLPDWAIAPAPFLANVASPPATDAKPESAPAIKPSGKPFGVSAPSQAELLARRQQSRA